jgi:hypothetical protein
MSSEFAANLAICHRCPHRAAPCSGRCACRQSGRDITLHAGAGDCPLGLHRRAASSSRIPLPGDVIESLAKRFGIDRLARLWEKRTGRSCGCARRKERMNVLARRLMRM